MADYCNLIYTKGLFFLEGTIMAFANHLFYVEIEEDKMMSFIVTTAMIFSEHSLKCRAVIGQW